MKELDSFPEGNSHIKQNPAIKRYRLWLGSLPIRFAGSIGFKRQALSDH